jgi:hypothetical protein
MPKLQWENLVWGMRLTLDRNGPEALKITVFYRCRITKIETETIPTDI